ncbi:MAG: hypothetical protein A3A97_02300 [Candidatus Terrybacteria bacterium RIFCSPLOWO2_01_FULL_40_23]|uniref:t-SNARE coiled-coil homology domain-containing protein n=1 Tax=Candidatus Terrybacteria bacterium RIFCSPLOWO2_01_FULL_40_23 TaxID=1802366 RepID=A0A1G2PQZ4_9BACT|nr:MAG: hypothetical protein A3A97_02300 [Candidatus Terrybacteria bacterium RIFCSPLOWO2_01_FULL_40_23]
MVEVKKDKKINKRYPNSEHYTQALLEDLNSKFDVFGEGLDFVKSGIETMDGKIDIVDKRVDALDRKVEGLTEMVVKNTEDIGIIKADLHIIKDDLKEKVGRDEFRVLEQRVAMLEQRR